MIGVNNSKKPEPPEEVRIDGKRMTEKRKEKLLAIQKREQMKDVLIERFKERVNGGAELTEAEKKQNEQVVRSEVEAFMDGASITENNLKRLDKKIRTKTSGTSGSALEAEKYSIVSGTKSGSKLSASNVSAAGAGGAEKESSVVADWRVLDEFALFKEEQSVVAQRVRKVESGKKVRSALGKQVAEQKGLKNADKAADRRWYALALEDVERYEKEEAAKADELHRRGQLEKQLRDEQLDNEEKARAEAKRVDGVLDRLTKQRCKEEIEAEERKANKIRQEQRDYMARVQAENVIDQQRRAEEKLRLLEQDRLLMKQSNERQDEEERRRQAEKDARVARNEASAARMASTVMAVQDAALAAAEARAEEENRRTNERAAKAENDKAAYLQRLRVETKDYHLKQMADKREVQRQEREEARLMLERSIQGDNEHAASERLKMRELRKRELGNQAELSRMMHEKGERLREVEMSETEKKMNRELMKQVNKQLKDAGRKPVSIRSPPKKEVDPEVAIRFGLKVPDI